MYQGYINKGFYREYQKMMRLVYLVAVLTVWSVKDLYYGSENKVARSMSSTTKDENVTMRFNLKLATADCGDKCQPAVYEKLIYRLEFLRGGCFSDLRIMCFASESTLSNMNLESTGTGIQCSADLIRFQSGPTQADFIELQFGHLCTSSVHEAWVDLLFQSQVARNKFEPSVECITMVQKIVIPQSRVRIALVPSNIEQEYHRMKRDAYCVIIEQSNSAGAFQVNKKKEVTFNLIVQTHRPLDEGEITVMCYDECILKKCDARFGENFHVPEIDKNLASEKSGRIRWRRLVKKDPLENSFTKNTITVVTDLVVGEFSQLAHTNPFNVSVKVSAHGYENERNITLNVERTMLDVTISTNVSDAYPGDVVEMNAGIAHSVESQLECRLVQIVLHNTPLNEFSTFPDLDMDHFTLDNSDPRRTVIQREPLKVGERWEVRSINHLKAEFNIPPHIGRKSMSFVIQAICLTHGYNKADRNSSFYSTTSITMHSESDPHVIQAQKTTGLWPQRRSYLPVGNRLIVCHGTGTYSKFGRANMACSCALEMNGIAWYDLSPLVSHVITYQTSNKILFALGPWNEGYFMSIDTGITWIGITEARYKDYLYKRNYINATYVPWGTTLDFNHKLRGKQCRKYSHGDWNICFDGIYFNGKLEAGWS